MEHFIAYNMASLLCTVIFLQRKFIWSLSTAGEETEAASGKQRIRSVDPEPHSLK